jgi:hypothetical protein
MSNSKGYLLGTVIAIGVIAFAAIIIYSASGRMCEDSVPGNLDVPGDAHNFDPVAQYEAVAAKAGKGAELQRISANHVRSDGTLDLHASYNPTVDYFFVRRNPERKKSNAPKGAGGQGDAPYQEIKMNIAKPGRTVRRIVKGGGCESGDYTVRLRGMQRTVNPRIVPLKKILEKPRCSFRKIWEIAKQNGADPEAVAKIEYNKDGYRFSIRGTRTQFRFNHSCKVTWKPPERKKSDAPKGAGGRRDAPHQ